MAQMNAVLLSTQVPASEPTNMLMRAVLNPNLLLKSSSICSLVEVFLNMPHKPDTVAINITMMRKM
jgi:hypothetical protein